jgi:Flp pilus assembly protein TadG
MSMVPCRGERGAAAVEFALVVPLLVLILFGVINFGFVFSQKASLSNAVRVGARFGSVNAYTSSHSCKAVVDKVRDSAVTVGLSAAQKKNVVVTVSRLSAGGAATTVCSGASGADASVPTAPCLNPTASVTDPESLQVSATYSSSLLVPTPGLGSSVTVSASSTFVCEYST